MSDTAERLRAILDTAVEAIITISSDGLIESFNHAAERLFQYTLDEAIGRNVNMLMPSPYQEEHDAYLQNYIKTGIPKIIGIGREVTGRRRDGTTFPMRLAVSEVRLADRMLFTGFVEDLTEQKRAEAAWRDGAERLRAILDTAVEAIITISSEGVIQSFNDAAEKLFGFTRDEVIGRNVNILMPPPYEQEHDGYLQNYLNTGKAKIIGIGREVTGRRKNGATFPMRLAVSEVRLADRVLFTGFVEDLTERKRHEVEAEQWREELEIRVEQRTSALERAKEELEHFAHSISHDLRTPLRGIRNYVDFLTDDLGDKLEGESAEDLKRLGQATEELDRMIRDLLAYTRIGRTQSASESVCLESLIDEIAHDIGAGADCEIVMLTKLPEMKAPLGAVRQIFQNLIENGLRYNRSPVKRIEVTANRLEDRADNRWRIAVRDNGIGIDPQYHTKIFGMFQRLHAGEDYPGTGIGLAAVRKAVLHLGGSVRLESQVGSGSTFFVELPEECSGEGYGI